MSNPFATVTEFSDLHAAVSHLRIDPLEQIALADRADWLLLRLVLCAAVATMLLAIASSLGR
jgi:hypothetical protein